MAPVPFTTINTSGSQIQNLPEAIRAMAVQNRHSIRSSDIVVIGSGVLGLTIATHLQQKYQSHQSITIIAAEFPSPSPINQDEFQGTPTADYASMWAGAHYRPIPYLPSSDQLHKQLNNSETTFHEQLAREHQWSTRTAAIMKELTQRNPECGVELVPAAEYLENPLPENLMLKSGDVYAGPGDRFRVYNTMELEAVNSGNDSGSVKWACEYETYVVNVHIYCQYLLQNFIRKGGKTVQKRLETLDDLTDTPTDSSRPLLVINCSGTGLPGDPDPKVKIIRGQTVLVRQQFDKTLTRQCADGVWSFLIPRPLGGGTIVGGTKQIGDTETRSRAEERELLLRNACKYFPEFVNDPREFDVVCDNVGRRPWRQGGVRLEFDDSRVRVGDRSTTLLHIYGAGGRGYELSWGIAEQAFGMLEAHGVSKL